jgi:hypothetical protein
MRSQESRSLRRAATPFVAALGLLAPASLAQEARNDLNGEMPHAVPAEVDFKYYLPSGVSYDPLFRKPSSVLGWEVGRWHVRHDQLVRWFETVAEESPRVSLTRYGATHEQRPLLLAAFTSPENQFRLDELRQARLDAILSGAESYDGPNVIWMGYGVHGNESSASNASLLLAYHLAAAKGPEIEQFLRDHIVLVDPCINPDGLSRFAQWANSHAGYQWVGDPAHREHNEVWPGGRTNHYWFDLNRDWLLLTHPESQGRLEQFHRWMPSILTDYHEMGSGSTYFFQPGIPSRQNPITPAKNLELTRKVATYHADALDDLGSLYYTEQSFDDFYYGKGSTYPDLHGAVGILFEQASSRGHYQENPYGGIRFPFTIRNQFTTSLSTLKAAGEMRAELGEYQREFFRSAIEEGDESAYVFGAPEDHARTLELVELLQRHNVRVFGLKEAIEDGEQRFDAEGSYVVPLNQPQRRFIRAVFETRTSWDDNTFYDVSSWCFPLSFDLPYALVDRAPFRETPTPPFLEWTPYRNAGYDPQETRLWDGLVASAKPVAVVVDWRDAQTSRELQNWLAQGLKPRVATRPFAGQTKDGVVEFPEGSLVLPLRPERFGDSEALDYGTESNLVRNAALMADYKGIETHVLTSGLTPSGIDLGSSSFSIIEEPKPLLLVGSGVSAYEAGEIWHHMDVRLGLAPSMVDKDDLGRLNLERYTHLILVAGAASGWSDRTSEKVEDWVRAGGILIATKSSATIAAEKWLGEAVEEEHDHEHADEGDGEAEADETEPAPKPTYADYEDQRAVERVAGTIFQVELDRTHPLAFGFGRDTLPVFKNSEDLLPAGEDPFAMPARYTAAPLLSGYASDNNVERIAGTPAIRAGRVGSGVVICMIDDPVFRGVWRGTERFLDNAIYFGGAIKRTGKLGPRTEEEALDYAHGHSHGK